MLLRLNKLSVSLEEWVYVGSGIENRGEIVGESREKTEKYFLLLEKKTTSRTLSESIFSA